MKNLRFLYFVIIFGNSLLSIPLSEELGPEKKMVIDQLPIPPDAPRFNFNFTDEDLATIINTIATKLKINIILPQGNDEIKQKISFRPKDNPLTFKEAIKLVETFLDLANYALIPKSEKLYSVIKIKEKYTIGEGLPLYVNVSPEEIPFSDSPIRAVFYLSNIKVPSDSVRKVLADLLTSEKSFMFDGQTNGIIITDKANLVATAMKVILELDAMGTRNEVVVVQLYNSNATELVEMIKRQIIGVTDNAPSFLFNEAKTESAVLFPKSLRLAAEPRTNSIIIMGKETAVERMQDFIQDVLDSPLETGESILRYYDLQYVDSIELEPVLNSIFVASSGAQSTNQAVNERFRGVKIIAERPIEQRSEGQAAIGGVYRGGNRLLIAARNEDWLPIKKLIEELDKPQQQVILEVLIVDLRLFDRRAIGSTIRSTLNSRLGQQGTYQIANLNPFGNGIIEPTPPVNPPGLETDLLGKFYGTGDAAVSAATALSLNEPGSLIISINDTDPNSPTGGVWGLIQILKKSNIAKVLSHPYLVTTNNRTATVDIRDIRRDVGEANLVASGGAINIPQIDVEAKLNVKITPRTSSSERVNLSLQINIEEFTSGNASNLTKVIRLIDTTANINTGQILVLGGLIRDRKGEVSYGNPLLSKIPILRWLFGKKDQDVNKDNLAVFIVPTIVEPRIRDGLHRYTKIKMKDSEEDANNNLNCSDFRDPITRFFFKPQVYNDQLINSYLEDIDKRAITRTERRKKVISKRRVKPLEIKPTQEEALERLQAVVAQEDNPLLSVKNRKG